MKYQKLISVFMTALALAACSGDEITELAAEAAAVTDPDMSTTYTEGVSDVEILLSSGASATRAIIYNKKNGNVSTDFFDADSLGIFMLATHKTGVNIIAPEVDTWYNPTGETYQAHRYVWLDNECAVATAEKTGDDYTSTSINWKDGEVRLYPFNNWYAYQFFGYYPYAKPENISSDSDRRIATITELDGEKDVIWGKSLGYAEDDDINRLRYCAKYFRRTNYVLPELHFEHKLMAFQFQIYGLPDFEGTNDYTGAKKMSIVKVQVLGVPSKGYLTVADRIDPENSGTFEAEWGYDLIDSLLVKPIPEEAEFEKRISQTQPDSIINVGNVVMLPIPTGHTVNDTYYVNIVLRINDDVNHTSTLMKSDPIMINHSDYKAGRIYNVKMGIAGPQEIKVNAVLDNWIPETLPEELELN